MDMSIEKMLSHVYEIEGLMLVTRRLGEENTPDIITNKIQRKVRELAQMCGVELPSNEPTIPAEKSEISAPVNPAEPSEPTEVKEPADVPEPSEPAEVTEAPEHLPDEDYDADETWQHDNGEEFKEVFALDYIEPDHEDEEVAKVPVEDREPDDDITLEFIEAPDDESADQPAADEPVEEKPVEEKPAEKVVPPAPPVAPSIPVPPVFRNPEENDEPVPEPDPAIVPEAEDEPDITVEFIEAEDNNVPEPEDEMPMPPLPTDFPEVVDDPVETLRVDEKLQRSLSKDIRKAFSVNDRFRFQRELFAGSASAMNTAIEHIEMMRSYGNAELYFFSQLHWDRDNEDVKDFMAIVRNHFQK